MLWQDFFEENAADTSVVATVITTKHCMWLLQQYSAAPPEVAMLFIPQLIHSICLPVVLMELHSCPQLHYFWPFGFVSLLHIIPQNPTSKAQVESVLL